MKRSRLNEFVRAQRGLTLVEIIVVLVILSILIAFLTGGLFSQGERAKAKLNQLQMQKLKSAINQYQLMYNALPPGLNALVSCTDQTGAGCVPVADKEILNDAWGTPFTYTLDSSARAYSIKSLGADRRDGGTGVDGDVIENGP